MSRPVFEPNLYRTDRKLDFSADQLFRRPAQTSPGTAIYEIKVFEDDETLAVVEDAFVWEIPEDLDGAAVVKVEAFISTAGSTATTVQIRQSDPCDTGADILSTPITIDSGECNSKDAGTQPVVIDPTVVAWGDHLHIDVDAAGTGAMGLGVIVTLAPAALASVILQGAQGAQGDPGGITAWTGQWLTATAYTTNQSVSNNGSSYAAIDNHTSSATDEPGVGANWEDHWQLLAEQGDSGAGSDGWTDDSAFTWGYASATTFTITGSDQTAKFTAGTRLRLTQSATVKYFVVVSSAFAAGNTTVTITGGASYSFTNNAVTLNSYSYAANPQGYIGWFVHNPTVTGYSSAPAQEMSQFFVVGNLCIFEYGNFNAAGSSNATTFTITLPIPATATGPPNFWGRGGNNSVSLAAPILLEITSSTVLTLYRDGANTAWTASGTKWARFLIQYQF